MPLTHRGVPHACLAEFRARLLRAGMADFLNSTLLELAGEAGVLGRGRAVDSTGMADSVATMDTVTLIRSALRSCLARLVALDPPAAAALRAGLERADYEAAGKPQILWSDRAARAALLGGLFRDAEAVLAGCRGLLAERPDADLAAAVALLATVAGQDLEVDRDDAGRPSRVSIRPAVAPDRVISTVDPQARHGHRSRQDRYDGYKLHLSVDTTSDLLTAVEASPTTPPWPACSRPTRWPAMARWPTVTVRPARRCRPG